MNRVERNEMVTQHLPLVGYLVSDLCSKASHLSRDDLASAGAIALITSADAFNPDLGVPFGAFARRRILGAFADEMRASDWATRSARRRMKETMSVQETLAAALGRKPSVDEIAAALGVQQSVVEAALSDASRTLTPLDEAVVDTLAAETMTPEHSVLADERLQYLRAAVKSLPVRMRYVVEEIYFGDRTVKELAAELGSTHAAVSQQRSEAIRLMRDGLTAHYTDHPGEAFEPQSRITPRRRNDYLSQLAEATAGGITRTLYPTGPVLNQAV
ncbi:sigma-70 family RNA polymerase sigma factor [Arthrobacter sp. AL08]|uniref:sigma-70 family RNA polymerase sigma factor n=1 Tax=unclassified Arthrobacter TaxID=235627 RepID=UPI00249C5105|nr:MULTISPECIES: sigma-70 family RNA polymerase sigma factor [unclassified Arthrobacter]MDI3242961.1 sigma-70 family RNA polymerase sigma factor [Arthrobacter sp. AL05]MDI3278969.1 sigma-70 family RNA polymerase sigma factor [Arthrobacter sp. AL08]